MDNEEFHAFLHKEGYNGIIIQIGLTKYKPKYAIDIADLDTCMRPSLFSLHIWHVSLYINIYLYLYISVCISVMRNRAHNLLKIRGQRLCRTRYAQSGARECQQLYDYL